MQKVSINTVQHKMELSYSHFVQWNISRFDYPVLRRLSFMVNSM